MLRVYDHDLKDVRQLGQAWKHASQDCGTQLAFSVACLRQGECARYALLLQSYSGMVVMVLSE